MARVLCPSDHSGNATEVPWPHLVNPTPAPSSFQSLLILSHLKKQEEKHKIQCVQKRTADSGQWTLPFKFLFSLCFLSSMSPLVLNYTNELRNFFVEPQRSFQ